jgi:hypothetical protein
MGTEEHPEKKKKTVNVHPKSPIRSGAVPQVCNPSYLGGRDQENSGSRPAQAKNCSQDPISINGWVLWYMLVIPATWGITNRRITVQAGLIIK